MNGHRQPKKGDARRCSGAVVAAGLVLSVALSAASPDRPDRRPVLPAPFVTLATSIMAGCTAPETVSEMAVRLAALTEGEAAGQPCETAWSQAQAIPDLELRALQCIRTVYVTARLNPERARAMADQLSGNSRDLAWAMCIRRQAAADPNDALKSLDHVENPTVRDRILALCILPPMAEANAAKARELLKQIQTDDQARDRAVIAIIPYVAQQNSRQAADLLDQVSDEIRPQAAQAAATALATADPDRAITFARSLLPKAEGRSALAAIVAVLAAGNPEQGLASAEALEDDPELWQGAAVAVAQGFLRRGHAGDTAQAVALLRRVLLPPDGAGPVPQAAIQLVGELARVDPQAARGMAEDVAVAAPDSADPIIEVVAVGLADSDAQAAVSLCDRIADPFWRVGAQGNVIAEVARSDWQAALELARGLDAAGTEWNRSPAYHAIAVSAARDDPEKAFDVAVENLRQADRTEILATVIGSAKDSATALALAQKARELLEGEEDPLQRSYGLTRVAQAVLPIDPDTGLAWLPGDSDPALTMTAAIEAAWDALGNAPDRAALLVEAARRFEPGVASEGDRAALFDALLGPLGQPDVGTDLLETLVGVSPDGASAGQ